MFHDRDIKSAPLRIHQAIARDLAISILLGQYQPGDLFEGEVEASERLQVSRTAYREAVRILVAKGLLESRPRAGTRVTARHRWNMLDSDMLGWMFTGEPNPEFVKDLIELRSIFEPKAAALAAIHRTQEHLDTLQNALDAMAEHMIFSKSGQAAIQAFHLTILTATHNTALITLGSSISMTLGWTTFAKRTDGVSPPDLLPNHVAVFNAIAQSQPDQAQKEMAELLRRLEEGLEILR